MIREKFPCLQIVNNIHSIDSFQSGNFFVIRSKKIDDIHKAVKYGVWTSSQHNNQKIQETFVAGKMYNRPTFFFFTYLNAPGFVGLAILDGMQLDREFPFFGEIGRWVGIMFMRWIFLRDVLFDEIAELKETNHNGEYRRMNEMTDGSRLSPINALRIIELMNTPRPVSHVFEKFPNYDFQEKKMRNNVEEIIRTNMMDIYKKKVQKNMEEKMEEKEDENDKLKGEIIIKKKLTQGEMKKLKKKQQKQQETD